MLSEDSYLLEGLQSADKTKSHPKEKLQNAPTSPETEATLMSQQMTYIHCEPKKTHQNVFVISSTKPSQF